MKPLTKLASEIAHLSATLERVEARNRDEICALLADASEVLRRLRLARDRDEAWQVARDESGLIARTHDRVDMARAALAKGVAS